jgi:hypothetical protein
MPKQLNTSASKWDTITGMPQRYDSANENPWGNLLSWEDMGQFASVTTYKAESIYNHGFALVRYIADKYGEDKLKEIGLSW